MLGKMLGETKKALEYSLDWPFCIVEQTEVRPVVIVRSEPSLPLGSPHLSDGSQFGTIWSAFIAP